MDEKIKDALLGICVLIMLGALVWVVGMFGAVETDQAGMSDIAPQLITCILLMGLAVFGINKLEKEEDIYDRL